MIFFAACSVSVAVFRMVFRPLNRETDFQRFFAVRFACGFLEALTGAARVAANPEGGFLAFPK